MELIYLLSNIINIYVWWMIIIITSYYIPKLINTDKDKHKVIKNMLIGVLISIIMFTVIKRRSGMPYMMLYKNTRYISPF